MFFFLFDVKFEFWLSFISVNLIRVGFNFHLLKVGTKIGIYKILSSKSSENSPY